MTKDRAGGSFQWKYQSFRWQTSIGESNLGCMQRDSGHYPRNVRRSKGFVTRKNSHRSEERECEVARMNSTKYTTKITCKKKRSHWGYHDRNCEKLEGSTNNCRGDHQVLGEFGAIWALTPARSTTDWRRSVIVSSMGITQRDAPTSVRDQGSRA